MKKKTSLILSFRCCRDTKVKTITKTKVNYQQNPFTDLLNPVGERPKCFILVRTRALSSCLSERLNRVSLCWLILSAALPGPPLDALEPRPPFLLSLRAHCMLFLLSSGWSEEWDDVETGSEEVELR